MAAPRPLILASSSETRRKMLVGAGLTFKAVSAALDEEKLKKKLVAEGTAGSDLSLTLAKAKAAGVAQKHRGSLVIGADQTLECDGKRFDKPHSLGEARQQLERLDGKTHGLTSAACVFCEGRVIWTHIDRAHLTMRPLSAGFVESYLEALGEENLCAAGLYQLEGLGSQLFLSVEGDLFTILGLPLFPLLGFLRSQGIMET
jgi:septum formation protein